MRERFNSRRGEIVILPDESVPVYTDRSAELVDMASAWGIFPAGRRLRTSNRQASRPQKVDTESQDGKVPKVFSDGKELRGVDLGAKGVMELHSGKTNWGKITSRATMRR